MAKLAIVVVAPCFACSVLSSSLSGPLCVLSKFTYFEKIDESPAIRYPDDSLDRLWSTNTADPTIQTNLPVVVGLRDSPPVSVLQTSYVASSNAGFYYNLTRNLAGTSYQYYVAFYFAELDSRVNASGLRVFDMSINGRPVFLNLDVYKQVGLYRGYEIYSPKPQGPYSDYILINATSPPTSIYTPFIAAAEILQVLDNPMVPATYPVDSKLYSSVINELEPHCALLNVYPKL